MSIYIEQIVCSNCSKYENVRSVKWIAGFTNEKGNLLNGYSCQECIRHFPKQVLPNCRIFLLIHCEYKTPPLDDINYLPKVINQLILDYIKTDTFLFTNLDQYNYHSIQRIIARSKRCSYIVFPYEDCEHLVARYNDYFFVNRINNIFDLPIYHKLEAENLWNRLSYIKSRFLDCTKMLTDDDVITTEFEYELNNRIKLLGRIKDWNLANYGQLYNFFVPRRNLLSLPEEKAEKIAHIKRRAGNKNVKRRRINKVNKKFKTRLNDYLFAKWQC